MLHFLEEGQQRCLLDGKRLLLVPLWAQVHTGNTVHERLLQLGCLHNSRPGCGGITGFLDVTTFTGQWLGPFWSLLGNLPGIWGEPIFEPSAPPQHCLNNTYYTTWKTLDSIWIASGSLNTVKSLRRKLYFSSLHCHPLLQLLTQGETPRSELNWPTLWRKQWKEACEWSGRPSRTST